MKFAELVVSGQPLLSRTDKEGKKDIRPDSLRAIGGNGRIIAGPILPPERAQVNAKEATLVLESGLDSEM